MCCNCSLVERLFKKEQKLLNVHFLISTIGMQIESINQTIWRAMLSRLLTNKRKCHFITAAKPLLPIR